MANKRTAGLILSDNESLKRYGSAQANKICLPAEEMLWLPSRVLSINHQLGGGIPYGGILELYGEESTGKSLLATDFGIAAQSLGGIVLWGDAESTFNGPWVEKNGLDLSRTILLPQENAVEVHSDWQADMIVTWRSQLKNNEPILLVVDSIGALDCLDNMNSSHVDAKADMGTRAKAIYKMLRVRNRFYVKYGVCVLYINQLRKKVGASKFENPDITTGGDAMKFFASQRLGLYRGRLLKDNKDNMVGRLIYVRTGKNKVAPPRENIKAEVYFKEHNGQLGYNKYTGLVNDDREGVLEVMGILTCKQGRYFYKGKEVAKGINKMLELIAEDDILRKNLIRRAGINTISKTRSVLEGISENRYPVKGKKSKDGEE